MTRSESSPRAWDRAPQRWRIVSAAPSPHGDRRQARMAIVELGSSSNGVRQMSPSERAAETERRCHAPLMPCGAARVVVQSHGWLLVVGGTAPARSLALAMAYVSRPAPRNGQASARAETRPPPVWISLPR